MHRLVSIIQEQSRREGFEGRLVAKLSIVVALIWLSKSSIDSEVEQEGAALVGMY